MDTPFGEKNCQIVGATSTNKWLVFFITVINKKESTSIQHNWIASRRDTDINKRVIKKKPSFISFFQPVPMNTCL